MYSPPIFHCKACTIEKIKTGNYKSHLRNKQIASIFKELELSEKYGNGVRRVIETCVAYGLPESAYETTQGGMAVTVFKEPLDNAQESLAGLKSKEINEGVNALLAIITQYPGLRSVLHRLLRKCELPQKILSAGSSNSKKPKKSNFAVPQERGATFRRLMRVHQNDEHKQ